ncbi:unnamed protein product [Merluccius merluccius]
MLIGLLVTLATTQAEIQTHLFPACQRFLYMSVPPQGPDGPQFVQICQVYRGKARYVTLYDTLNRIPVYSAYTFKRSDGATKVGVPWMYEPQREDLHERSDDAQAALDDYRDTVDVVRGQLNPDAHQSDLDDKDATYTLTNVVPQVKEFSEGPWAAQERVVRQRLNNYCLGAAYVVTGAAGTAGRRAMRRYDADRVAVPDYVWSAYCCVDHDCNAPYHEFTKFPAFASLGVNREVNNDVQEMSVQQLQDFIKRVTGQTLKVFYLDCE